jgi:hypothetical protein
MRCLDPVACEQAHDALKRRRTGSYAGGYLLDRHRLAADDVRRPEPCHRGRLRTKEATKEP